MTRRGAIVEFIGPPGAGKSLLAEHLRRVWLDQGFRAPERKELRRHYLETGPIARWTKRRFDKGKAPEGTLYEWRQRIWEERQVPWLRASFSLRHPRAMRIARRRLAEIRAHDPEQHERVAHWLELNLLFYEVARRRADAFDLFVWEEGIATRAVNLFADVEAPVRKDELQGFLRVWAMPDALVIVRADPERCARRITERGLPTRLSGVSSEGVRRFVLQCSEVVDAIGAEASRRNLPIFAMDNDGDEVALLLAGAELARLKEAIPAALGASPTIAP